MITPTLGTGIAQNESAAKYPFMWRGLKAAYAPCLARTGLTLHDYSGFGWDGTLTNFDLSANGWTLEHDGTRRGYALDFDGTADHVVGGAVGSFGTSNVTLMAWVNIDVIQSNNYISPLCYGRGGTNPIITLGYKGNGSITSWVEDDGGTQVDCTADTTDKITAGTWAHIGIEHNRITDLCYKYVNGVQQAETVDISSLTGNLTTNDEIMLGAFRHNNGNPWAGTYVDGKIDDWRVYDRTLATWEWKTIVEAGRGALYEKRRTAVGRVPPVGGASILPQMMEHNHFCGGVL